MLFSRDIGIDLGTSNTKVADKKGHIIINEPSVVAVDVKSKRVLATGNEANALPEDTKEQAQFKSARLKEASKELDLCHKKAYDYIQARKLMKQVEYYSHWDERFESEPEIIETVEA